jgi:hypothetical protein
MKRSVTIAMFLAGFAGTAAAQEPVVTASHERAAIEIVELLQLERMTAESFDVMMQGMAAGDPAAAQMTDIMKEFFAEFMPWAKLKPEYVKIYASAYSEAELGELAAFLRTPLGRKWVDKTPELMQQSAEMSQRMVMPHMPELQRRIMARIGGMQD